MDFEFTEEERNVVLSMLDECEHGLNASDDNELQTKFHLLKQHVETLFSKARSK